MTSEQESIPVLTQIYVGSEPPVLSPAFFEFAMAQLKPFLDKAITEAAIENQKETIKNEILDELRSPLVQQFNEETVNALEITKQSLIRDTGDFLDKIMSLITFPGALFLALIAVFPAIVVSLDVQQSWAMFYGGTSLIIMVGVATLPTLLVLVNFILLVLWSIEDADMVISPVKVVAF